jgi:hypothetical protein
MLQVFLLSTRAGAVGINLVAAQRLVLYDTHWNPVHNKQVRQQADLEPSARVHLGSHPVHNKQVRQQAARASSALALMLASAPETGCSLT